MSLQTQTCEVFFWPLIFNCLSVPSKCPWLHLLTSEEQSCQPLQLPRKGARHGLRERLCRWRAQHVWGSRQSPGLLVLATSHWTSLQCRQSDQPGGTADHATCQRQDALHRRLQRRGVAGRRNVCHNFSCRSSAAWGDLTVLCFVFVYV